MGWFRAVGRGAGAILWVVALAPMAALLPAALLDRGPDGAVRFSVFPAGLAAFDPYVWEGARNSLAVAAAVTFAARVVGVGLARAAVRRRFWGRSLLVALAGAGAVVPPAFGALGVRQWLGPPWFWPEAVPWVAWFWVALTAGAPLVGLAAGSALARIDPVWEDAARLAGADRRRVWRQLVWPSVRPDVARALGVVFTLTLLEPGAPLILGLRRTLGVQVVEAATATGGGRLTRAAVLAAGATLLAGAARVMIGWWGGPEEPVGLGRDPAPWPRAVPASRVGGAALALLFGAAAVATLTPVLGVAVAATGTGPRSVAAGFAEVVRDPLTRGYLRNSAALGLAVVALDLLLARALAAWSVARRGKWFCDLLAGWYEKVPPLAVGVGVLALPEVLRMAADAPGGPASRGRWAEPLAASADLLDPDRFPWLALAMAVGLVRLPMLARSAVERRRGVRPVLVDAAVGLGATARQARRRLSGRWLGVSPAAVFLAAALAASGVTPALVLSPTAESRPLGAAVLTLADEPGGLRRAAALALPALAANLAALAVAARGRKGLLRSWFRG